MRRVLLSVIVCLVAGGIVDRVPAADVDALKTTTEFGITLSPDDLTDAIEETQQFWEPVHQYIGGADFDAGDPAVRKDARDFFNTVQEGLYHQLFERDEAAAQDLVDYLGLRVRKYMIYRQLRSAIGDDAAMALLVERWERANRDINALAPALRPERAAALLAMIDEEMKTIGVSTERRTAAMKIWTVQSQCVARMNGTQTGEVMIGFERKARELPRPVGEFLREVMTAADWAMICKSKRTSIGLAEFKQAWTDMKELHAQRLTSTKPTVR
jgi:hypothetical protein